MKLQRKIAITIFAVSAGCFLLTMVLFHLHTSSVINNQAIQHAHEFAMRSAQQIETDLNNSLKITQQISTAFENINQYSNVLPIEQKKALFQNYLRSTLEKNFEIHGLGATWGKTDKNQQFAPYFYRNQRGFEESTVSSYHATDTIRFYENMKNQASGGMLKPYFQISDKNILMTTLFMPVYQNEKLITIINLDIKISNLFEHLSNIKSSLSNRMYLVYQDGDFLIHPDKNKIMSNIEQDYILKHIFSYDEKTKQITQKNKNDDLNQYVTVPIDVGNSKQILYLIVSYPINDLFEANQAIYQVSITVAIASTFIITLILIFLLKQFVYRPLFEFTQHIQYVQQTGILSECLIYNSDDEIGSAIQAYNQFCMSMGNFCNEISFVLKEMSEGNCSHSMQIQAKGDFMKLKKYVNDSVFNLKEMSEAIQYLTNQLNEHEFSSRVSTDSLSGSFKVQIEDLNLAMIKLNHSIHQIRYFLALKTNNHDVLQSEHVVLKGELELLRLHIEKLFNNNELLNHDK